MPNGIEQFESALYEYLQPLGFGVFSQATTPETRTTELSRGRNPNEGILLSESASVTENDLGGPISLVTASYDVECHVRSGRIMEPEARCKAMADAVFAKLVEIQAGQVIGTETQVIMDSAISLGQGARQIDEGTKAGLLYVYNLDFQFNFYTTDVPA